MKKLLFDCGTRDATASLGTMVRIAQLQQKGYAPSAVTVTSRGVEITFEAVKR